MLIFGFLMQNGIFHSASPHSFLFHSLPVIISAKKHLAA